MKKTTVLAFNPQDVLKTNKIGDLFLGNEKLSPPEAKNLQAEVAYFRSLRLCDIFLNTVREQARMLMFEKAETYDDMRSGKAVLHAVGVLENILNTVEKAKPDASEQRKHTLQSVKPKRRI